jgi:hypothetical protein
VRHALWGALCLGLAGCGGVNVLAWEPPQVGEKAPTLADGAAENAYREILERASDRRELYDVLDTRMFAAATYQSATFREARARRHAAFQKLPADLLEKNLAEERAALATHHELFFGAHVNEPRFDDFDRGNSIWRIALVTANGEVAPAKIERIGRATLDMRALYPYMGDFWTAYRIVFPLRRADGTEVIPADAEKVTLKVASTLGSAELRMSTR